MQSGPSKANPESSTNNASPIPQEQVNHGFHDRYQLAPRLPLPEERENSQEPRARGTPEKRDQADKSRYRDPADGRSPGLKYAESVRQEPEEDGTRSIVGEDHDEQQALGSHEHGDVGHARIHQQKASKLLELPNGKIQAFRDCGDGILSR